LNLTLDEEKALLKALDGSFPAYTPTVVLAMNTGPRRSELFRGQVGDSDPKTGKLAIRQTKVRKPAVLRHVPLTPLALDAYNILAEGKPVGAPLCSQLDGESQLTQTQYWFDPCVKEAGLVDFHFHDLRHTAASRWVMNGVPLAVVSRYLGNANIQMTMRYAHMSLDNDERAIAAMMPVYTTKTGTSQHR
jgi:integrase